MKHCVENAYENKYRFLSILDDFQMIFGVRWDPENR